MILRYLIPLLWYGKLNSILHTNFLITHRTNPRQKIREWRGIKDTMYDYFRWLGYWKTLIGFTLSINNIKGFLRYRWMLNYLAMPDYMDRHTEGMRGVQLRMAHQGLGLIVTDICEMLKKIFRADPAVGNDQKLNSKIVLFDENMMSMLM